MPSHIFNFARKALIQQLPTASNLHRWKKIDKPECCLCNKIQSNKHVLANCSASVCLERYTDRHNNILQLLAEWLSSVKSADQSLYADIPSEKWNSVDKIFQSTCRPDLVLVDKPKYQYSRADNLPRDQSWEIKTIQMQKIPEHSRPHPTSPAKLLCQNFHNWSFHSRIYI